MPKYTEHPKRVVRKAKTISRKGIDKPKREPTIREQAYANMSPDERKAVAVMKFLF